MSRSGAFGLIRPRMTTPVDHDLEVLRLLGRLGVLTVPQINLLAYPRLSNRATYRRLTHLATMGQIAHQGNAPDRFAAGQAQPPPRSPGVYMLTPQGRSLLIERGVEPEPIATAMHARVPRKRGDASDLLLPHDRLVAWWGASLLAGAARNPLVTGVHVQTEWTSAPQQRLDAFVLIRLSPAYPRDVTDAIPWWDGSRCGEDEREVRLALEVDRGTEALPIILKKAVTYRDLTLDGTYTRLLGGPLTTVFIVPDGHRAGRIAAEWQHAWPEDTWSLISTPERADHPQHGVIWGSYRTLAAGTPQPLLRSLTVDALGQVQVQPVVTLAEWERGMEAE